ncbi:MAG TPA: hypothetical protein VFZ59_01675 [Verrucomicrobiae bacterium]|nr:hypothetical protein [Verrucomicrobiae bacterium]
MTNANQSVELRFDPEFIARAVELRSRIGELKAVEAEIALGRRALTDLAAADRAAQDAIYSFVPSQIISFGSDVERAFSEHRKLQFQRAGLNGSLAELDRRQGKLKRELWRLFGELQQQFTQIASASGAFSGVVAVKRSGYIDRATALGQLTETMNRGDLKDQVNTLLSLCIKHGAELPEAGQ